MTTRGAARATHPSRRIRLWQGWFDHWIARRGPARPPLALKYRQIFILPTRFGWTLGLLMFAMLMGSLNFNNNLGLLTTFIVAGLASNSMLLAFRNLQGLELLRTGAAPVFAGQTAQLMVSLSNRAERNRPGLELKRGDQVEVFDLPARGLAEISLGVPTQRRGWLEVERLRVQTSHPIGLFEAWSWFWPERAILVWPQPASSPPPWPDDTADQHSQQERARQDGDEFFSLRPWRLGDPLHRVAWKASQRHDSLLARELRQPQSPELRFDLGRVPGADLEQRISILTAWILRAHRDARNWTLTLGAQQLGPARGERHLHDCLRALAEL